MKEIFDWLWILQLQITVMIGAVLILRLLLLRAPRSYSYFLWILVFLRLLCPVTISSPVSIIPSKEQLLRAAENLTGQENGQDMQASVFTGNAENPLINPAGTENKENAEGMGKKEDSENIPIGEKPEVTENKAGIFSHIAGEVWIYGAMFFVWVLGAAALILYNVTALSRLKRKLKEAKPQEEGYYVSSFIETPFVLGFFSPRIYLPKGVGTRQLTYILKHEQTHIARWDYIIKPLCLLLTCVYWFNPILWAAFLLLSRDMEMSCDEIVLKSYNEDIKAEYSRSLLQFASGRKYLSVPLAFGENGVKSRIANVLRFKKKGLWISAAAVLLCAAAGVGLLTTRAERSTEVDSEEGTQNEDSVQQEDGGRQEDDGYTLEDIMDPKEPSSKQMLDSFVWQDSPYHFYETGLYKVLADGGLKCVYPGDVRMSRKNEYTISDKYCYFWVDLEPLASDYWTAGLIEVDLEEEIWRVAYDSTEATVHEIGSFRLSEEPYATETHPVTGRIYTLGEIEETAEGYTAYWDLDLDGEEEEIRFIDMQNFYLLTVNGSSQGFYGSYIPSPPQAISLDGEKYYLIVYDEGPSGDPLTHFFYYGDGILWKAGEIPDNIAEREINEAGEITGYYRFDLMQTEWAKVTWVFTDKGVMIKEQEYYEHAGTQGMELLTELPVHSEMSLDSETTILSPGPVELLYTDLENWYYIADENGKGGWFHMAERFGMVTELEKECWEVFGGLNYAD